MDAEGSGYEYVYQYKDHLGNIRLTYADSDGDGKIDASEEIISENNYYPFGLKHKGYNNVVNGTDHKYGFGGKEEQDELGLGWIDITARNYDPALGRWMNLDPLAEKMRRHSPYNYAFDNPVYFIDYDGMMPQGSGDPWYKKIWRAVKKDLTSSQSSEIKQFKRDTKKIRALADKFNSFTKGDSPRDSLEEGITIKTDSPTDGGMESIPKATRDADVTVIDEQVVNAAGGIRGSVKNPRNSKNALEALDDGMGSAQKVLDLADMVAETISDNASINTTNTDGEVTTSQASFTFSIVKEDTKITVGADNKFNYEKRKDTTVANTAADKIRAQVISNARAGRKLDSLRGN